MTRFRTSIAMFVALSVVASAAWGAPEPTKTVTLDAGESMVTAALFSNPKSGFGFIAIGTPPEIQSDLMPVWDLQAADLDGDGTDELLVGTWSRRGPQRDATQRTIRVLRWDGKRLRPVWRGTRLPHGFERFTTEPSDRGATLVTFGAGPGLPPARYRWTGFGFASTNGPAPLRVVFLGDTAIARGDPPVSLSPPKEALEAARSADFAIANLEASIGTNDRVDGERPNLVLSPKDLQKLDEWGIDAVSRANNHALDGGRAGWHQTTRILVDLAIHDVTHTTIAPGVKLLAATRHPPRSSATFPVLASAADHDRFVETVRREASTNTLIVSIHGGPEGRVAPTAKDRRLTVRLIQAGADVVVWHGAHRAAPTELVDGAIVAWNLGDFALKRDNDGCALHLLILPSGQVRMASGPWACEQ